MSWGRHRKQQNVRDYSKEHAMNGVRAKMMNRWHLLAPFPLKVTDLYKAVYTKEEAAALRVLRKRYPSILREEDSFELLWNCDTFKVKHKLYGDIGGSVTAVPTKLTVKLPRELPIPRTEGWRSGADKVLLSDFPPTLKQHLTEWAMQWVKCSIEYSAVEARVDACFNSCNTMGQVKRVWPNLCSFLPDRAQEILRDAKVQSKLPDCIVHQTGDGKRIILPMWRREELVPFDMLITEALILPDREDEGDFPVVVEFAPWHVGK